MGEHKRQRQKLFIALPTYGFQRYNTIQLLKAFVGGTTFDEIFPEEHCCSLLAYGFNELWAHPLAERTNGLTHFLLLPAAIVPREHTGLSQLHQPTARVAAQ